ncbi:MAG: superoxide dismutase [Bacteroidia bacterium]|nr:MAG: superoxide dismutase [Bacteroidia bacterium]
MVHKLPELPYALDALNPHISKQTLEFHHGKHHLAYINNLNGLIEGTQFENAELIDIVREAEGGIFNNAAQAWNHSFYFEAFSPNAKAAPEGALLQAMEASFGSFEGFKEAFTKAAATQFGSGWAWLSLDGEKQLKITQELNAGNPLKTGLKPLLTCDVWEHAYYLDYQNRRPDYLKAFWPLVNWELIEERYKAAMAG